MEIKINDSGISNCQIGNNNTMYVERGESVLRDKEWKELQLFIDKRLVELLPGENTYEIGKKAMTYVKNKDESGLRGFIIKNKDAFFTNLLSDLVSSGLISSIFRLLS